MDARFRSATIAAVAVFATVAVTLFAQRSELRHKPARPPRRRRESFRPRKRCSKTLDDAGRAKALYPFDSTQKTNWSNLPSGIYQTQ